jgi:probable HAF family extracellular repeat protein
MPARWGGSDTSTTPYNHRTHAFLYTPGTVMQDLGSLGGILSSWANGLNDLGQVVGQSTTDPTSEYHAFLWTSSRGLQDLGSLTVAGDAINNAGQVVGTASYFLRANGAFIYRGGVVQDLTSLVQNLPAGNYISAINDRGQIAATRNDGRACLLTPVSSLAALDLLLLD